MPDGDCFQTLSTHLSILRLGAHFPAANHPVGYIIKSRFTVQLVSLVAVLTSYPSSGKVASCPPGTRMVSKNHLPFRSRAVQAAAAACSHATYFCLRLCEIDLLL